GYNAEAVKILIFAAEGLTKRSAVGFLLRSLIMFQTFISRHNSNFFSDKLVLTSVRSEERRVGKECKSWWSLYHLKKIMYIIFLFFFFKQKTAYEIGLGIPAEPLFRSRLSGMALLILALLQRIFLMSSLMLLLVWLIFFMVLIKLLPILGTISGKTVKLMVLALICLGNNRQD